MDIQTRIHSLPTTTFCGRRFSRQQILYIVETVATFTNLSRQELALTLCEHLDWKTPRGSLKVNSALQLLEKLETLGLCKAPAPREDRRRGPDRILKLVASREPLTVIESSLDDLMPVSLKIACDANDRQRFNALMNEHHYLGYKRPFGAHLRYVVLDRNGSEIGLLLFAASAWSLKDRDDFIGWQRRHRVKRLHLVVNNSRFLIFPWIKVPNLASKVLSLATARLASDWQSRYGYTPVMIETFVDAELYFGTSYQAAGWLKLGSTTGRGRSSETSKLTMNPKDIYVKPLVQNFREILLRGDKAIQGRRNDVDISERLCQIFDPVISFWTRVAPMVRAIASEFDEAWQVKRRVIDSMLLVLLIFRLVATRSKQSYGTTIDELWENCRKQGLPLPQKRPIAASSFAAARRKLDEQIFKTINTRILNEYEPLLDQQTHRYFGHRVFATDGTKLNLPPRLTNDDFMLNPGAHYPIGLLSALYRLGAQVPVDFILTKNLNERISAISHLEYLSQGDVVVYDRGYFGFGFAKRHEEKGVFCVFRLSTESTYGEIEEFFNSSDYDRTINIAVNNGTQRSKLRKAYPGICPFSTLTLRCVKYQIGQTVYCLGTTLLDERYSIESLKDLYHGRWGIEELYKISKQVIAIEEFHAKCLRGVRQEIYAHMAMITLNRIFTNHGDDQHRLANELPQNPSQNKRRTNFKSSLAALARNLEGILIDTTCTVTNYLINVINTVVRRHQKIRPNRSYPRHSKKPINGWWKRGQRKPKSKAA